MLLQILRLETPTMTCQDLIAQQSKLRFGETSQISNIQQLVLEHPTHLTLLSNSLLGHTVFQIVRCQYHRIDTIAIGIADCEEIQVLLLHIVHAPTYLASDKNPTVFIVCCNSVASILANHWFQKETVSSHVFALAIHFDHTRRIDLSGIESSSVPPAGTVLDSLSLKAKYTQD